MVLSRRSVDIKTKYWQIPPFTQLQFLTKRLPRLMTYAGTRCIIHAHEDGESVAILIGRTTLPITKGEEFTNAAAEGHMTASGSSFSYRFKAPFRDTESVSSYRRKPWG